MIFKNGTKEYTLSFLLFAIPMGILYILMYQSIITGLLAGIISGALFTLLIYLFVKYQEKKFSQKRAEIANERNIICDGSATFQGNGGWMFFTSYGIEFYPHKLNLSNKTLMIPVNAIGGIDTKKNQLIIHTVDNQTFPVVVCQNKQWTKIISKYLQH